MNWIKPIAPIEVLYSDWYVCLNQAIVLEEIHVIWWIFFLGGGRFCYLYLQRAGHWNLILKWTNAFSSAEHSIPTVIKTFYRLDISIKAYWKQRNLLLENFELKSKQVSQFPDTEYSAVTSVSVTLYLIS